MIHPELVANELEDLANDQPQGKLRAAMLSAVFCLRREAEPDEHPMSLDEALNLAGLWHAGKMIGGDPHAAVDTLYIEIQRLRASLTT